VLDTPEQIKKTVMSAQTDSGRDVRADPARPGITNLLGIYAAATGASLEAAETHFADARGYGDVKKELVEILVETLRPLRERYAELSSDPTTVRELLQQGADAVRRSPAKRSTARNTRWASASRCISVGRRASGAALLERLDR